MLAPYADAMLEHPCGTALMSVEQIASAMRACTALEVGFAAHAIGDGAVRACLDAAQSLPPLPRDVRRAFRIEHAELIDQADVPRFAELGLTASVQPCHLLYDIEALERSLPDRLHRVLPLRDLVQAGLVPGRTLLFGSDTPIVRPNPEDSIQAAVHRRRADSPASRAIAPLQAISEDEAWACFAAS
jgi:predicted amidohydrolase YtcJ